MNTPVRQCRRWKLCPMCLAGERFPWNHTAELNRRFYANQERERSMPLKKPDLPQADNGAPVRAREGDSWVLYPTIMEYLTEDSWDDRTARVTSTLSVFFHEGTLRLSINDRALDRVAFVTATGIEELLAVLEAKLKESSLDWRKSSPKPGGKRR